MSLAGTVVNGVIVLDDKEELAEGTRVEVLVKPPEVRKPTLAERLLRHAGTVPDLPADMGEQHKLASQSQNTQGFPVPGEPDNCQSFIWRSKATPEEMECLLDEFASGPSGKVLPPDFSRADIYEDHD
jgi:hypothetical protein